MDRCKINPAIKGIHGCEMMEHLSYERNAGRVVIVQFEGEKILG